MIPARARISIEIAHVIRRDTPHREDAPAFTGWFHVAVFILCFLAIKTKCIIRAEFGGGVERRKNYSYENEESYED